MLAIACAPVLSSLDQIATLAAESGAGRPAALHIDTGMNRLGLSPDEVATLAADRQPLRRDLRSPW